MSSWLWARFAHREDTEKSVLGSIIMYWDDVQIEDCNDNIFSNHTYLAIFKIIKELKKEWLATGMLNVRDVLVSRWLFGDWMVDNAMLIDITSSALQPYEFTQWTWVLKGLERRREIQEIVEKIQMDTEKSSSSLLGYAEELIRVASVGWDKTHSVSSDDVDKLYEEICDKMGKELFGYSWWDNLKFLDKSTRWIQWGVTYRIWAASNVGKSQMMYNVINSLMKQGAKVAFFTLENRKSVTLTYVLANYQRTSSRLIESGEMDWQYEYLVSLKDKLYIVEDLYDIDSIFTKTLEIKPDVVILDYIWLTEIKKVWEEAKYAEYAKKVQQFVKRSWVAWIDLSNLPRDLQSAENIRTSPQFYWSTFLRNNTDVGIHLYYNKELYEQREAVMEMAEPDSQSTLIWKDKQFINLFISKNRLGTVWLEQTFKVDFSKWGLFLELPQQEKNLLLWR